MINEIKQTVLILVFINKIKTALLFLVLVRGVGGGRVAKQFALLSGGMIKIPPVGSIHIYLRLYYYERV